MQEKYQWILVFAPSRALSLELGILNHLCRAGGDCLKGGADVSFAPGSGTWNVSNGMYVLTSCPAGHQLINSTSSTSYGEFNQAKQQCKPCTATQYIVDQLEQCQSCPTGATCDGAGALTGLEGSHWRREGDKLRVHHCDAGYIMVRIDDNNGQKASQDDCIKCLAGYYSVLGANVSAKDPCVKTNSPTDTYQCFPLGSGNVTSAVSQALAGAWTDDPSRAQSLCNACPAGVLLNLRQSTN
jgi:hypothetical protein